MKKKSQDTFREFHRYLGYFLAGIMFIYALSGIVLTFRNTDFLKYDYPVEKIIETGLTEEELGPALGMRITIEKTEENKILFNGGYYDQITGEANFIQHRHPMFFEKMNKLHKMTAANPLFWLAIFFGVSLMFFSVSAFFMFKPSAPAFKKGMYFAVAGAVLTIVLLLV
ncbi:MAG: hypothetical protein ACO388_04025 [Saprospiraceae bacterium]|jgi:hypothetical protein